MKIKKVPGPWKVAYLLPALIFTVITYWALNYDVPGGVSFLNDDYRSAINKQLIYSSIVLLAFGFAHILYCAFFSPGKIHKVVTFLAFQPLALLFIILTNQSIYTAKEKAIVDYLSVRMDAELFLQNKRFTKTAKKRMTSLSTMLPLQNQKNLEKDFLITFEGASEVSPL